MEGLARFLRTYAADLLALGILGAPLLTGLVLARWRTQPRSWLGVGVTALAIFTLLAAFTPVFPHSPAPPVLPVVVGAVCCALFAWCVKPPALRVAGAILFLGATAGFNFFWLGLSHRAHTAKPRVARWHEERTLRSLKGGLFEALAEGELRPRERLRPGYLSGGWYQEHGFAPYVSRLRRVDILPEWHSPLTGLGRPRETPLEVWTPGGTPEEAARGLELRERPTP